jgi:hypothetical protein
MKHFTLFAALCITLAAISCGSARALAQDKKDDNQQVQQKLDAKDYTINVDYMIPMRGSSQALTTPYSLTIKDNTVKSYLPYFGQARSIPYGGGDALNFEDEVKGYSDSGFKKDSRIIKFKVEREGDILEYSLTVYDNGHADIFVNSQNRDSISFRGEMDL